MKKNKYVWSKANSKFYSIRRPIETRKRVLFLQKKNKKNIVLMKRPINKYNVNVIGDLNDLQKYDYITKKKKKNAKIFLVYV